MTIDASESYNKAFYDVLRTGVVRSAEVIVPLTLQMVPARGVVDVGCGEGAWLAAFRKFGVEEVLGLDGEYVDPSALFIPRECFESADLSRPFSLERTFDLAVSLEVAEHLPVNSASWFVESLARLAPAVLFSAAIPLQGGVHHVNEQWPDYWVRLFEARGFVAVDAIRKRVWQDERVQWWYAQNILLFVRPGLLARLPELKAEFDRTDRNQLRLVHPSNYSHALVPIEPAGWRAREALKLLRVCVRNGLRRRLFALRGNKSQAHATKNPPNFNAALEGTTYYGISVRGYGGNTPTPPRDPIAQSRVKAATDAPAPQISVLINTFNNGHFIEDAIDSALAQDFPADQIEIIVVDDGSTDDTPERLKKYEGVIRYFRTKNGDQCSAVTFGVARAAGDIVALLDGDDVWLPNKLSRVAQEFAKDPRTVMVYHKYLYWDSRDGSIWDPGYVTEVSGDILGDRRKLLAYSTAPTSSLAFRRDAFEPLTRIPLNRAFTYDLFLTSAVLFLGPIACIPEPLTRQRIHGRNRFVCGQDGPDEATVRRRIARWKAAMEITRDWMRVNAPRSARPQARILLRRWQLFQDSQEFLLDPPNRLRSFVHNCCAATVVLPPPSRAQLAYRFVHAFAALIVGRHARYLEGVRTRVNRLRRRMHASSVEAEQRPETAGNVK